MNFCEFDKYATKSYCAIHNVDESLNLGDITKVDETKLEPFNMICGGSPCQDFSVAGKQKGSVWTCKDCGHKYNPLTVHWSERDKCPCCGSNNIEKTRSSLLVEYLRVIRANKPNFGMYENVKNIVGKQFKDTFKMFTDELDEYGYNVYWKVLNAKDYGIPQNRERVYMIFIKKELDNDKFEFPKPFNKDLKVKDLLEDVVDEKFYIDDERVKEMISKAKGSPYANKKANFNLFDGASSYAIRSQEFVRTGFTEDSSTLAARDYKDPHCVVVGKLNSSQDGVVVSSEGIVPTLTAGHSNTPEDLRVRKVTPKECFRLMGFPDSAYQAAHDCGVSNTQLYKQAGNSIVVDVLYYILKELYNAMPYLFDDLQLSSYFSGIGAFEIALDRLYKDINTGNFTKSQMV